MATTTHLTSQNYTEYISGGGLAGTNYVYVSANGTDIENAAELQAAYITAQTMSPSYAKRITIIAAPGNYNFFYSYFTMDAEYINLVSLDGNRSIIFNSSEGGTINITANDVFVKGVDTLLNKFTIATNLNLLKVENCAGGNYSFGGDQSYGGNPITVSGTFINCEALSASFGFAGTASGTFINCKTKENYGQAFGDTGIASGIFKNCEVNSAGGFGGQGYASGTFIDCMSKESMFGIGNSFGEYASGTFIRCQAGSSSFGKTQLTGKVYYCRLISGTFQTVSGGGITRYCLDGTNTANNQG